VEDIAVSDARPPNGPALKSAREGFSPALTLVLQLAALAAWAGALVALLVLVGAEFAGRAWLHLAWLAPALLVLDLLATMARRRARRTLGEPAAILRLAEDRARAMRPMKALVAAMAMLPLAIACARPQWGQAEEQLTRRGVDVFILLDTSRSMLATDVTPDRLSRAKIALSSLVDRLGGDRIALIAFAGDARIACPLTTDHGAVKMFLDLMEADVLQVPGTAIGDALRLVNESVPEDSGRSLAVVLLTDGEDHEGGVDEAVQALAARGAVVHAIGIGTEEGSAIPAPGAGAGWLQDESGKPVASHLEMDTLQKITSKTGGVLAKATSNEMELSAIASAIESMEQQEISSKQARIRPDRQQLFLALAFALFAIELALPDGAPLFPRRRVTRTERAAAAALAARSRRESRKEAA
jgi:Ca-activated chloride channel family protein